MSHRRALSAIGLISLFAVQSAEAQQKPAVPAAPAAPAPTPAVQTEPALPDVSDPLLAPPPPPARVIQSWQEALAMVRDQSVTMRLARANVLQAQATAREALAPALPQLQGRGTFNHHLITGTGVNGVDQAGNPTTGTIPDPTNSWVGALNLTVPIFHPFDWYNHGTAKDFVDAARLSQKEQERLAVAAVADAIVSVVTAERLAEVSRSSLKAALSTVDLTKRRAALGASNTLDVLRVEGEASLSRSQVVASTETLIRAREALGSTLGTA
jgi:outer membrane protein TolC